MIEREEPRAEGARPRPWASATFWFVAMLCTVPIRGESSGEPGGGAEGAMPRCLFVSSYHRGYAWQDDLEEALRAGLAGRCELEQFDLDTKRRRADEQIARAVQGARSLIASLEPALIVISDDNAARHLAVPHIVGGPTPLVFAGLNWSVEEYGFPTAGVTGIVEVAPIRTMMREALRLVPEAREATYIGADTFTERKNYERIARAARSFEIELRPALVGTAREWNEAFVEAQDADFLVVGSSSGVADWSDEVAARFALEHGRRPSLTNHQWMMPVTTLGITKIAAEQGAVAAAFAVEILGGRVPESIPLVINRDRDLWINEPLADRCEVQIPESLRNTAKRTGGS